MVGKVRWRGDDWRPLLKHEQRVSLPVIGAKYTHYFFPTQDLRKTAQDEWLLIGLGMHISSDVFDEQEGQLTRLQSEYKGRCKLPNYEDRKRVLQLLRDLLIPYIEEQSTSSGSGGLGKITGP